MVLLSAAKEALPQAATAGQAVPPDLENALRALAPVVVAAAKSPTSSQVDLSRAITLVQRTAAAMESLQERLRQTEHHAMEFVHNARNDLALAEEKVAILQQRIGELENALTTSNQLLESEQENLREAREWLIYLHDHIVEGLSPAADLLDKLNSNTGPLLPMLVAATVERAAKSPHEGNVERAAEVLPIRAGSRKGQY